MITTDWKPNLGPDFSIQTFAVGDVHGQADALALVLDHIETLPRTQSAREMIFLGDLVDRGPSSVRAMHLAVDAAVRFDECSWLPGNHELTMIKCLAGKVTRDEISHWYAMGARETFLNVCEDPYAEDAFQFLREAVPDRFRDAVIRGPTHLIRNSVLFVHAGIDPAMDAHEFLQRERFKAESYGHNHWSWIRDEFLSWEDGWEKQGVGLVVHGHTPAAYEPIKTAQQAQDLLDFTTSKRRINVDAGAAMHPQVASVEFSGEYHRLHVSPAPGSNNF